MKVLRINKSAVKKVSKAASPSAKGKGLSGGVRRNNHALRVALEKKGFAALSGGSYIHDKIDVSFIESKMKEGIVFTPCVQHLIYGSSKGTFAFTVTGRDSSGSIYRLPNGKWFSLKALPGAVEISSGTKIQRKVLNMEISVKLRSGAIVKGLTSAEGKTAISQYACILTFKERDIVITNVEFGSNKHNASNPNVARLVSFNRLNS